MRTTVRLDDKLLAEAKKLAIDTGRTFAQVIEDALRIALAQQKERKRTKPVKLHTCGGNGLQPGVDLSNNAAVQDLMDEYDGFTGR
ncbi:MAG TPA: CopG family transcriptional regulator [Lacipirellulaceae bacterium]|nr:CopG family transcriptional regulator [Lacipirellulaceae bacterium]